MAQAAAARGAARLSLAGRNVERLEAVALAAQTAGATVHADAFNMLDACALAAWVEALEARAPVDLAIANAGVFIGTSKPGTLETPEEAAAQIDLNLTATSRFLLGLSPALMARGRGRLMIVSSIAGLQPVADEVAYSASKAGLNALGEALREFVDDYGVGVTVACPGFVATPMKDTFRGPRPFEWSAERAADRLLDAAARGRDQVAFPWQLTLSIRLGRLVPWRWRRMVTRRFRFRFD